MKGHTTSTLSSQKLSDFLVFLHQEWYLLATAIMGYKAMLNGIFCFQGFDLSNDKVVTVIIRAFCQQVCHSGSKVPAWNVDVVLRALLAPPFKSMDSGSTVCHNEGSVSHCIGCRQKSRGASIPLSGSGTPWGGLNSFLST